MVSSIGGSGGFDISAMKQMQQQMFKSVDGNSDGKISKDELSTFQKSQQASSRQGGPSVDEIFKNSDSNSDGGITLQEMQDSMAKIAQQMMQEQVSLQAQNSNNPMSQLKQNFDDLGGALKAGNIDAAKKAFAQLQKNAPGKGGGPMNSEINSLSKALDAGDLKGAQEAYSKIKEKMSQGPQGMMSSGSMQSQETSTKDDLIKTLLAALSKEDDSKSSSTAKKNDDTQGSKSTDNSNSVKDMLATAIKNYSSHWGKSYAENTNNATSLASAVYG